MAAANLSDPKVVVLHVGHDKAAYDAGHIPGARFLPWSELTATRRGIPNELPPVEQLVKLFERLGVSDDSRVVFYGENLGQAAARAWFTLDYLGHGEQAALLDGGLEKWRAEKRPISQEEAQPVPARLTPRLRPEVVIDLGAMRDLSGAAASGAASGVALLDARSPADYASHIPGAASLHWMAGWTAWPAKRTRCCGRRPSCAACSSRQARRPAAKWLRIATPG